MHRLQRRVSVSVSLEPNDGRPLVEGVEGRRGGHDGSQSRGVVIVSICFYYTIFQGRHRRGTA